MTVDPLIRRRYPPCLVAGEEMRCRATARAGGRWPCDDLSGKGFSNSTFLRDDPAASSSGVARHERNAAIAMVVWGRISDRMNERRWNLFIACVFSTVGLVIAGMTMGTWWALVGMSIAAMGFYGSKGPFFAMPPMFLSGAGLAAGIAWINSIGNLGGFFGPWYVGVMKDLLAACWWTL
jgi:nitrate/nitrite transporter NarK